MNIARQAHNTPPLSCSKSLEDQAQAWAQELFDRGIKPDCKLSLFHGWYIPIFSLYKLVTLVDISEWYDPTTSEGEAVWLALTPPILDTSVFGLAAAQTFYQRTNHYNHVAGHCAPGEFCDDYTQMMWASSDKAGIGVVQDCPSGSFLCSTYVVMRFSPKGQFPTITNKTMLELKKELKSFI